LRKTEKPTLAAERLTVTADVVDVEGADVVAEDDVVLVVPDPVVVTLAYSQSPPVHIVTV
jgi:hypothetical protein